MVGRLSLQDVPELVDAKKKGDGVLDSPDSGLPPSPSPSHWGLAAAAGGGGGGERPPAPEALEPDAAATPTAPNPASLPLPPGCALRLCPLSFGEGVEFDPLPPKEIRYTSSVTYDSERHFMDGVQLPLGLAVASCSQTVTCLPNCTWRNYKAEVRLELRHKPSRFLSTTIVYDYVKLPRPAERRELLVRRGSGFRGRFPSARTQCPEPRRGLCGDNASSASAVVEVESHAVLCGQQRSICCAPNGRDGAVDKACGHFGGSSFRVKLSWDPVRGTRGPSGSS
uniref:Refilin B n=1 Tax=Callithrix jacchus TaxID=9483 RepID=A0A8J8YBS9_CALJA